MKLLTYNAKTLEKTEVKVPSLWAGEPNMSLLAQAFYVYTDNSHKALAKTKGRGEVSASTRKIYRQKGTGNARHGSVSAPIFVGGGIAHGPTNVKKKLHLPRTMKAKALESAYRLKVMMNKLVLVTEIYSLSKTKEVSKLVEQLKRDIKNVKSILFVLEDAKSSFARIFRNVPNVSHVLSKNANAFDLLRHSLVVVAEKENSTQLEQNSKTKKEKVVDSRAGSKKAKVEKSQK